MDCHTLHNEFLRVEVRALGAALNRVLIRAVDGDVDLLWNVPGLVEGGTYFAGS